MMQAFNHDTSISAAIKKLTYIIHCVLGKGKVDSMGHKKEGRKVDTMQGSAPFPNWNE